MLEEIEPNLHVFYSPNHGSNVYILIGKKTALIDTSISGNAQQILSCLESLDLKPSSVDLVLFTHGHADHFGCSHLFSKAEKRMHGFDAERISLRDREFTCSNILGESNFPEIDSVFEEGEVIELKPFKLKVLFTPGHTPGSVCFFDRKKGLLFSGDTLFRGSSGRTDLPNGSELELIDSLKKLSKLRFSRLFPGHGLILKENQQENISEVLKNLNHKYI